MNKVLKDLKKLKDVYYETEKCKLGDDLEATLQLLTSSDETEVHAYSSKFDQGLAYLYSVKRETLGRAIIELNGNKIPSIIEDGDTKTQRHIWLRENVLNGWSQILIDELWGKYAKLLLRLEEKIGASFSDEEEKKSEE